MAIFKVVDIHTFLDNVLMPFIQHCAYTKGFNTGGTFRLYNTSYTKGFNTGVTCRLYNTVHIQRGSIQGKLID